MTRTPFTTRRAFIALVAGLGLIAGACGSDDSAEEGSPAPTETSPRETGGAGDAPAPTEDQVEVVSVGESFWTGGWIWEIDEITVTHPAAPTAPIRIELVGTGENLTWEEDGLQARLLVLLHDGVEVEDSNWDRTRAGSGETAPIRFVWNIERDPESDDAVSEVDLSDLELVWGDERPTRAHYVLDGSAIRTNEPVDLDVSSFEVDGFDFDIKTAQLWFDPARRDAIVSAPEFAYVLFDWTVTNNTDAADRQPTTRLLAPDGDSHVTMVLAGDTMGNFAPGEAREETVRYEFHLEPGSAAMTVNGEPVVQFEIPDTLD